MIKTEFDPGFMIACLNKTEFGVDLNMLFKHMKFFLRVYGQLHEEVKKYRNLTQLTVSLLKGFYYQDERIQEQIANWRHL